MKTCLYDFLEDYNASGSLRAHMPGHKGKSPVEGIPRELYALDITEISGADSLFDADGIIAQSEKNMSRRYKTAATIYSAGGSTLCIQTMLALMKRENRHIFAVRNVHRAFINAAALLGIEPEWITLRYDSGILSGKIHMNEVEALLSHCSEPACLYVTSPDYTGRIADIKALAELCHRYSARLIVDNAHGAHLAFFEESLHPIALGADMCCDSAHKLLPALTGAAMLHTSDVSLADKMKQEMSMFGSTSPSYLVMMSMDLCGRYMDEKIRSDIAENLRLIESFRRKFSHRLFFAEGEPFHITVKARESGLDGSDFADRLRQNGVECEYSDSELVILLMSPVNTREDYALLTQAVEKVISSSEKNTDTCKEAFTLPLPPKAMGIREAVFSPYEKIPVQLAEGRICGEVKIPCPPAIPIAVSGELITKECVDAFEKYNISHVNVLIQEELL